MAEIRFEFGRDPNAAKQARRAVCELLLEQDPIKDDVLLVVSELVNNVIKHTPAGGVLWGFDPHPDVPLRIEVEDHEPTPPRLLSAAPADLGGRGLALINSVCDAWGTEPLANGKRVWAVFDRTKRLAG